MIIYKLTNRVNGKSYIGQTIKTLNQRVHEHCVGPPGCRAIRRAIDKYGIDNFDKEIIIKAQSREDLNELETKYILRYNSLSPNGYNLNTGGNSRIASEETKKKLSIGIRKAHLADPSIGKRSGLSRVGRSCSLETRLKLSKANKGQIPWIKGKHWSEEYKKKLSEVQKGVVNKGRIHSAEHNRKIGLASKGNKYTLGLKHTDESKEKIRQASLRNHQNPVWVEKRKLAMKKAWDDNPEKKLILSKKMKNFWAKKREKS